MFSCGTSAAILATVRLIAPAAWRAPPASALRWRTVADCRGGPFCALYRRAFPGAGSRVLFTRARGLRTSRQFATVVPKDSAQVIAIETHARPTQGMEGRDSIAAARDSSRQLT